MNIFFKFKKFFFLLSFNLLCFSSNFALTFIVDFASLVTNCYEERMALPSYFYRNEVEDAGFKRLRQNFISPNRFSLSPADLLMDICSHFSTSLWGSDGDIIKRFYKGEVKEEEILEFLLSIEDAMGREVQQRGVSQEKSEALRIAKNIFWGQFHQERVPRNQRESIISFLECFKQTGCLHILRYIKDFSKGHTFYLIGDLPKKWFELYIEKFNDIFFFFSPDKKKLLLENIRFSFQSHLMVDELDYYLEFFEYYNRKGLDSGECYLITSNQKLSHLESLKLFKLLFFDPKKPQVLIQTLKDMGVLNNEQSYFAPGI